tara:strand:+ start:299480 stop:302389 length:2910 start_codon:yes stop_codon:yes gene_type:complete
MNKLLLSVFSMSLIACGPILKTEKKVKKSKNQVVALELSPEQRQMAYDLGLSVEGEALFIISGDQADINKLNLEESLSNEDVLIENQATLAPEPKNYYLAKKDFNIPSLLAKHPTFDGRGVIVGGIDDGVSPSLNGLQLTTEGKRKFINRTSGSDFYTYEVKVVGTNDVYTDAAVYTQSYTDSFTKAYETKVDIETKKDTSDDTEDYNGDGDKKEFDLSLYETTKGIIACIDLNTNEKIDQKSECLRPFSSSGDYLFWNEKEQRELTFEYNKEDNTITLSEGEVSGDSHGEGVASVMTGHKIGGLYDGVAPGAQYIDYDLSQRSEKFDEKSIYSVGTFVRSLDWMGQNGAEVVNISYSLFFYSAKAQDFMRKALKKLVEKHNFVISFSAGNNGPGLGSHNRGAIYPKDVLVAGAYLNKELDENVHGVTGLPDQGQVVYYSSIGPGVHGGMGPTVISPLSSLTHSSGTDGYRAFNGTSSASPALAGAAAVLISSVKQLGLKVDAGAIVHALRLSAQALVDVPYVVQGAGLPKVDKAIEIYKELIQGKAFKNIEINIAKSYEDGLTTQGLVYRTSETRGVEEEEIQIKGVLADLAPSSAGTELLEPVRIEYSHDFIKGAKNLWVGNTNSRFYIEIDLENARKIAHEVFGEIKILSVRTGKVIQVIPVTVINDYVLNRKITIQGQVAAQDGHRLHINVPAGVKAVGVRMLDGTRLTEYVRANFYNSSRVRQETLRGLAPGKVFFHPVSGAEYLQFTIARYGGTGNKQNFRYEVFPISLEMENNLVMSDDPSISIVNNDAPIDVELSVHEVFAPIKRMYKTYKQYSDIEAFELTSEITEPGSYSFSYDFGEAPKTSYFYFNCMQEVKDKDGEVTKRSSYSTRSFSESDLPVTVTFKCYPFDYDDDKFFGEYTVFGKLQKSSNEVMTKTMRIKHGTSKINLSDAELTEGSKYEVKITPAFEGGTKSTLGTIEAI